MTAVTEALRRAEQLTGWAHPERYAPLPDTLPAAVPPVPDFYAVVLAELTGGRPDAG